METLLHRTQANYLVSQHIKCFLALEKYFDNSKFILEPQ